MEREQVENTIQQVAAERGVELTADEVFSAENFSPEIIRELALAAAERKKPDLSKRSAQTNLKAGIEELKKGWGITSEEEA